MGGEIGVCGEPGDSATFWFTVAVQGCRSVGAQPARAPASEGRATAGQILLAEDNPVNQRVATAMLENLGFEVDVVADGAQAVLAASAGSYRAILMDGQMPVLDGYQATSEIRRLSQGSRRTPIIAVTGSAMKSDQQRCLAAGMDDYLAKPLNLNALADTLKRWAPDQTGPPTSHGPATPLPVVHVGLDHLDDPGRPALDAQVVDRLERLGNAAGEDLMGQLAALFLADADVRVVAIRQALACDDAAAVVWSAHTLSGAAANLGATVLARLCGTLAADSAVGDLGGGDALREAIEGELGRVRIALVSLTPASC
jgi:two-component system, sensor histidine kinase and response regulator